MKYKSEVIGKNGIAARIVAKSVSPDGIILPTWEYDVPKCILAELNTHAMLSKNAQSSRAVPVKKVIEQIRYNPVIPVHWGSNQAGMVAGEEIDNIVKFSNEHKLTMNGFRLDNIDYVPRDIAWKQSSEVVAEIMEAWDEAGYHKQIVNRIGEAFTMVRGVITGTEIDNFFHLRYHKDADPYIQELARCMWEAYEQAEARELSYGDWHTPYYKDGYWEQSSVGAHTCDGECLDKYGHTNDQALKISAAGCGQVSYRKLDLSEETVERVWNRLMGGDIVHASVTAHQGTPLNNIYEGFGKLSRTKGLTHYSLEDGSYWSANFRGWVQFRKTIPNECFKGSFRPPKK